jgi:hypothetical protein
VRSEQRLLNPWFRVSRCSLRPRRISVFSSVPSVISVVPFFSFGSRPSENLRKPRKNSSETRPSHFEPPGRITAEELADWPFRVQEAELWINSPLIQEALESARLDWSVGDEASIQECPCTFCLMFDQWGDFGTPMLHVRLMPGGDDFTVMSGGLPLDVDELAIPAGKPQTPDFDYRPPAEPIFDLEPTDVPPGLIGCIRQYFESHHHRDWDGMAGVNPNESMTSAERTRQLESRHLGDDFGRWGYARYVDNWWQEGSRACVVVRGIEHRMAFGNYATENRETVWTFSLRLRGGVWIIAGYSQGWPGFGSAQELPSERKLWRQNWKSGTIV